MDLISIGVADNAETIQERLQAELSILSKQGIEVNLDEREQGNLHFFDCSISAASTGKFSFNDIIYIFKHYIANAISDIILEEMEKNILKKSIDLNYYYFNHEERARILDFACKILGSGVGDIDEKGVYKLSRKARILQRVLDYLELNTNIMIDGFIRFRLKEYVEEIEEVVDKAVEEYLMEREYNEFIKLLRYFVEIQEPKVNTVNVLKNMDGSYTLIDEEGRIISNELLDDLEGEVLENNINYEDLLVSSLITIAPTKIVFHSGQVLENSEVLDTVRKVFYQRVIMCYGCDMCRLKKPIEKE